MIANDQYTIHILLIMCDQRNTDICDLLCITNSIISPHLTFSNTKVERLAPLLHVWEVMDSNLGTGTE